MKTRAFYPGAFLALVLGGCADPLVDPEVVIGLRVLGAKASAATEPERAQLSPGEAGQLEWWLVDSEPRTYQARAAWCLAKETSVGLYECAAKPFLELEAEGDTTQPLTLDFELPSAGSARHWLAWLGACTDGAPSFDWRSRSFACPSGSAVEGVYEAAFTSRDQAPNANPVLTDDRFLRGSTAWPALDAPIVPDQSCADSDMPKVRAGQTLQLRFRSDGDDREALETNGEYGAPERESLVFTHVATTAGLERAFSALDWNSDKQGFELEFTLPETPRPPAAGRSIGFYLVARDERGGSAFEGRELCAVR